ncbi:hypothetical protein FCK90_13910 [Kocuria coralli]|uniref:Uncharacterized protein n=1 Tax=Kocuria coralli TaxID=1461025 RepID=A0A5J5KUM8_9MICC|nr:hypothetical protein [Kocuria coralli]KAA9393098.1 hypothetical protein FCK90_13910 [Kocuria coralli]
MRDEVADAGFDLVAERFVGDFGAFEAKIAKETQTGKLTLVELDHVVVHFLTADADHRDYLLTLNAATRPGSHAVLAAFASDGPTQCTGLHVARYDVEDLGNMLADEWRLVEYRRQEHRTPSGSVQPLTWATFRRWRQSSCRIIASRPH